MRFPEWRQVLMVLLVVWCHGGICRAEVGDVWRKVYPSDGGGPFEGLAFQDIVWTGSHYLVAGVNMSNGEGSVMTSLDGRAWTPHPVPTGGGYLSGLCQAGNKTYLCGGSGGMYRSLDGGLTWTRLNPLAATLPYGMAWTGTALVVVGGEGQIYTSNDEGATWVPRTSGVTTSLTRVIWTGTELVAVGSKEVILRSNDDGVTWVPGTMHPDIRCDFTSIQPLPGGGLVAAGNRGRVLLSYDGGSSWTEQTGASAGNVIFRCVVPVAGGLVGITDGGYIYRAATLTSNWEVMLVGHERTIQSGMVLGDKVMAVGTNATILEYDGVSGKVWDRTPWTFRDIWQSRMIRGSVWAVGSGGEIMFSRDGGKRWQHCFHQLNIGPVGCIAPTATGVLCGGFSGVMTSNDEGASWQVLPISGSNFIKSVGVVGGTWLACGDNGKIFRSTDGGATWGTYTHATNMQFNGMEVRGTRAVVVSSAGDILTSDNAGVTWTPRASGVMTSLSCVTAISDTVWLAGGDSGVILYSGDGGTSWAQVFPSAGGARTVVGFCATPSAIVAAVRYVDSVGAGEPLLKMMRSTNGGLSWTFTPTACSGNPLAVVWTGEEALIMGSKGLLMKAPAAGFPWTQVTGRSGVLFNDVERAGDSLFAVGNGGLLAESTDHGVTWKVLDSGTTSNLNAITWTGSALITMSGSGSGKIRRSTNMGLNWTSVSGTFPTFCDDIVSGNGTTILMGTENRLSTDHGVTWSTPTTTAVPSSMYRMEWANGYFYGNRGPGTLMRSVTGTSSWTTLKTSSPLWHITAKGSDLFGATPTGLVGMSLDSGANWASHQAIKVPTGFTSVEWTGRHLVATSTDGTILISGEQPVEDYLWWAAGAALSGEVALPGVISPRDGLANAVVYAWDTDRDGVLSATEREQMPQMVRRENTGEQVLRFLLPPSDRDDLSVGVEKMQADGSWTRVSTKLGARGWQGSVVPSETIETSGARRYEVMVNPAVESRGFYRMAFEIR